MGLLYIDGFDSYATPQMLAQQSGPGDKMNRSGWIISNGSFMSTDTRTGFGTSLHRWIGDSQVIAFNDSTEIVTGYGKKHSNTAPQTLFKAQYDVHNGVVLEDIYVMGNDVAGISIVAGSGLVLAVSKPNIFFPNTWNFLECRWKIAQAGRITVKLNGDTVCYWEGDTRFKLSGYGYPPNTIFPKQNRMLIDYGHSSHVCWLDDFYILDATNGGAYTDFLGDVTVKTQIPISDYGPNDFAQIGGTAGHHTCVSQVQRDYAEDPEPPNRLTSNIIGAKEMYGVNGLPIDVIDVLAVQVGVRIKKDSAGNARLGINLRSGDAESQSLPKTMVNTYFMHHEVWEARPNGSAWDKTTAEATKIGFQLLTPPA